MVEHSFRNNIILKMNGYPKCGLFCVHSILSRLCDKRGLNAATAIGSNVCGNSVSWCDKRNDSLNSSAPFAVL